MAQLLVIEDNATMREGIVRTLSKEGHEVTPASGGKEGVRLFREVAPDFVITDLKMEDMDGIDVLRQIRENHPEALVMIITAFGTIETAVEAMKLGALDFITKPFSPDLLRVKVNHALDVVKTKAENQFLRRENWGRFPKEMIGNSSSIMKVQEQVARVAPTDSTVLVTGESGSGKELVARALHAGSPRAKKQFIKVDCTALAEGLLESELFGHERGAFTGAVQRKPGRFELADGGTIFLDEIGEISPSTQVKLLRVLQDRCFERVGGTRTIRVDVRIVSATNKDLLKEVTKGRFREDLYYRLHIVPIHLPPLRERPSDIKPLVRHFCSQLALAHGNEKRVTEEAIAILRSYQWPGNIRELENVLERAFVLTPGREIGADQLPQSLKKSNHYVSLEMPSQEVSLNDALEELERKLILRAYNDAGGVKTKTAELLGIKPSALYYKLEKNGRPRKRKNPDIEFSRSSRGLC